jgi:rhodanese-related sulfurtransferase
MCGILVGAGSAAIVDGGAGMSPTSTAEIDIEAFAAAHAAGGFVVDCREPGEYVAGHVPDALLIPLGSLGDRAGELAADHTVYVICASGNRSLQAVRALTEAGHHAVSVAGGTAAWVASGRLVVTGERKA